MLAKFLTIIFIFLNPFAFLFSQAELDPEQKMTNSSKLTPEITPHQLPTANSLLSNLNWGLANTMSGLVILAIGGPDFLPIRNWNIGQPAIEAKAALIFAPAENKILYQKNIEQVLPIASLTKLMTGLIVLEEMDLEQIVTVSREAVAGYGDMGGLVIGEKISVKNLLHALLMESSNDAAIALAQAFQERGLSLVSLMNKKAEAMDLSKTYFVEPTGYDPANLSTALDLAKLVKYSLSQPLIWQILKTTTIDLPSADGLINHHLTNTNQLLGRWPTIVGGKTGYTDEAEGCMILVIEQNLNNNRNYPGQLSSENLIMVILGTQERFLETEKLINWVSEAYIW